MKHSSSELAMKSDFERQLESLWQQARVKKQRKEEELRNSLMSSVSRDLTALQNDVRISLGGREQLTREKLEELARVEDEFSSRADIWQQKADDAVSAIQAEQTAIHAMITAAKERIAARKVAFVEAQRQRAAKLETISLQLLHSLEEQLSADEL